MGERFRPEIRQRQTIGATLRASREALGLSQHRVADLTAERGAPVSRSAICDIERGINLPGVESLVSLCDVLQLDTREILERVALPAALVQDVAGCSLDDIRRRIVLLYWSCQYRATVTLCAAVLARLEHDRSIESAERQRLRVRFENMRASALKRSGRLMAAEAAARRSLQFASGTEDLQIESLVVLSSVHCDVGLLPLAQAESDQAVRMANATGSPRLLTFAWSMRASRLFHAAQFEESAEAYRLALGFSIRSGEDRCRSSIEGSLGACLSDLGHPSAALRRYSSAVEFARKRGDPGSEVCWQLESGRLALRLEATDEAEKRAAAALTIARTGDNPYSLFRGIWLQHQIARRRNSSKPDRHRIAQLKRLYPRVAGNRAMDVIREFRSEVLGTADA